MSQQSHRYLDQAVEEYPGGYPRLSALLGQQTHLRIFRQFNTVRMRLLLLKQDRISMLESELNEIDQSEDRTLLLDTIRGDRNEERREKLLELDGAISDYGDEHLSLRQKPCQCADLKHADDLMSRSAIQPQRPRKENIQVLKKWVQLGGLIARKEGDFLDHESDLLRVNQVPDQAIESIATAIAHVFLSCYFFVTKHLQRTIAHDQTIYTVRKDYLEVAARSIIASLAIFMLLTPVIILHLVQQTVVRFVVIFFAAAVFVSAITIISKASMTEIFVAGATYAAVLVVFVSSNGISS